MFQWLFDRSWAAHNPQAPASAPQPESSGSFTVQQGKRYRATVVLSWIEQFAGNDMIASKLREVGFKDITVTGSGETRIAEAVWPGPNTTAPLPAQLRTVSEIA